MKLGIRILSIFVVSLILITLGLFLLNRQAAAPDINSFEDCATAGYPIMESWPRKCATPDGRSFTEAIIDPTITPDGEQIVCTMDAKLCPDGSYVGRIAPDCSFAPCPQ